MPFGMLVILYSYYVNQDVPPPGTFFRITDNNERRITDSGDKRITD